MFNNEVTWLFIAIGAVFIMALYFVGKLDIEKEHTKQLELQLKLAQISLVSTNNIGK